ncbi:MAG TPA: glycosyltransferase [Nocardioides sp.]|nr:glycosyltransferase [Nocardioides sp.]
MKRGKLFRSGQDAAAPSEATSPGKTTGATSGKGPDRLVGAGVVDRAFYEALTGRSFESDREAAQHFLREAAPGHSPHPLIDPALLPAWVRDGLARGEAGPLLRYLRAKGAARRLGPLFDSSAVGTEAERNEHPGGALGLFLASADDETPLPGHPALTWGAARTALTERARLIGVQEQHAGSRVLDDWDEEAEDRWRAEWAAAPLPDTTEGTPLVSVVIPVRNRPRVVASALQSVSAQTLEDWELVVVDDGSTDETPQVLAKWAAREPRIRVVTQDWAGVSAARNRGLAEARGRYVAFLDSDNRWRADFLRLAVAAMHGQGLRAAYAAMALHEDERIRYRAHPYSFDDLKVHNYVDQNVLVVERELAREVGGFDEQIKRWVDHDFALRLGRRAEMRLLPFVGVDYDASLSAEGRITTSQSPNFQFVVLGRQWVDWDELAGSVSERVPGRLSVIVPTHDDSRLTTRAVESVLQHTADTDLEVVIVDNGSAANVGLALAAEFFDDSRVRYTRLPRDLRVTVGWNVGFAASTGEHVAFLSHRATVRPRWWEPLGRRLAEPWVLGAQALLLNDDDTISSAGLVFPVDDAGPCAYLEGHPPEDADRIADRGFHAVSAGAMAMRAADFAELRGFDPLFADRLQDVDLCLRAASLREGRFVLEPGSRVNVRPDPEPEERFELENRRHFRARWGGRLPAAETHRWDEAGFAVAHFESEGVALPGPRPVVLRIGQAPRTAEAPALRWGIAIAAGGGARGDGWGDTHFARSLAGSLRELGQDVVTHRRGAVLGPASRFDDVVLSLRGLEPVPAIPGKVNVLWVISHPDDVTAEDLVGFDLVYAASESWAEHMSEVSGRPVQPLLQATDTRLRDVTSPIAEDGRPVFVGSTNPKRPRQVVLDAVAAGVEPDVHGQGWAGTPAEPFWRSSYVANDQLMTLYRTHGIVIADHWGDMAREGFLANRLFDAVASGARVVSDRVPGLEVFEGAVQAYTSVDDLRTLCGPAGRDRYPSDEQMAAIADRVAAEHSFDKRAHQLLDAVAPIWAKKAR